MADENHGLPGYRMRFYFGYCLLHLKHGSKYTIFYNNAQGTIHGNVLFMLLKANLRYKIIRAGALKRLV